MTVGGMGFIPERLLMMMMMILKGCFVSIKKNTNIWLLVIVIVV